LGYSDAEFDRSTPAKIYAEAEVFLEWDMTRDYFPALNLCMKLNNPNSSQTYRPEDILELKYFIPKRVTVTGHDPDHGAIGGTSLKAGLKSRTDHIKKRRKGYGRV